MLISADIGTIGTSGFSFFGIWNENESSPECQNPYASIHGNISYIRFRIQKCYVMLVSPTAVNLFVNSH